MTTERTTAHEPCVFPDCIEGTQPEYCGNCDDSHPQVDMWTAHYAHPDGRTQTATIKAVSYSGAKVCARNGEEDGFTLARVVSA